MAEQLDLGAEITDKDSKQEKRERARDQLLRAASSGSEPNTILKRVAWVLNHYPDARDSDRVLWFRYWSIFESELWDGTAVTLEDSFRLTHPGSLTRARAKIQNEYKLFQASLEVRQRRGKLAEEERQKALTQSPPAPLFAVYADESGKNADYLIVGSLWILDPREGYRLLAKINRLKNDNNFRGELHFKEIEERNVAFYEKVAHLVHTEGTALGFKAIAVERRGIGRVDEALQDLYYHLLVRGVQHEHDTGRAPLPRRIHLTKDLEEPGRDKVFLANLKDRVDQAAQALFQSQLTTSEFETETSNRHALLQIADLYTGSVNRVLNNQGNHAKDRFAQYFLTILGTPEGPTQKERIRGDLAVLITL